MAAILQNESEAGVVSFHIRGRQRSVGQPANWRTNGQRSTRKSGRLQQRVSQQVGAPCGAFVRFPPFRQDKVFLYAGDRSSVLDGASRQANALGSTHRAWDLFEPYCGNGNFTVPMSAHFRATRRQEWEKDYDIATLLLNLLERALTRV